MRPVYVRQKENHEPGTTPTFWASVDRGNGKPTWVSETFFDRNGAKRAARALIALIGPDVPVVFSYCAGEVGPGCDVVVETIR